MASSGYTRWLSAGQPYALMTPAHALQAILRDRHGLTVYDYPDDSHLLAATPEDHTPFSVTGWPIASAFGTGHALDIMPHSGISLPDLARTLINARNAGESGVMWIKYINWTDEHGVCQHVSWEPTYATKGSTDKGHIHISGRSDCDVDQRANNYDPLERNVSMELNNVVSEVAYDTPPAGWNAVDPGAGFSLSTFFGAVWRRVYLIYRGTVATYAQSQANGAALSALAAQVAALTTVVNALQPSNAGPIDGQYTLDLRKVGPSA